MRIEAQKLGALVQSRHHMSASLVNVVSPLSLSEELKVGRPAMRAWANSLYHNDWVSTEGTPASVPLSASSSSTEYQQMATLHPLSQCALLLAAKQHSQPQTDSRRGNVQLTQTLINSGCAVLMLLSSSRLMCTVTHDVPST